MENKLGLAIAFAAGLAIGMNYGKIRKTINPYLKNAGGATSDFYEGIVKFMAEQKEKIEDIAAEMGHKKSKAAKVVAKKTGRPRKLVTAAVAG